VGQCQNGHTYNIRSGVQSFQIPLVRLNQKKKEKATHVQLLSVLEKKICCPDGTEYINYNRRSRLYVRSIVQCMAVRYYGTL
jgi:hypothetical protein